VSGIPKNPPTFDDEEDSSRRLNRAGSLLESGQTEEALSAFEDALAFFRRRLDERRELILILNFVRTILERGDKNRALKLAERAEQLASAGQTGHRLLAALYLGQVWAEGMRDARKGLEKYKAALELLQALFNENPTEAQTLLERLGYDLAMAGQTALDAGDLHTAAAILRIRDPQRADTLEDLKPPSQPAELPDTEMLRSMRYPGLDEVLAAWRAAAESQTELRVDGSFEGLAKWAWNLNWKEPQARIARMRPAAIPREDSPGGPAGLLHLAQLGHERRISLSVAIEAGRALGVADDDLPCLCLFTLQDPTLDERNIIGALLNMCGHIAVDHQIAAHCHRALGVLLYTDTNPSAALEHYEKADARLEGVVSAADLRADVRNDISMTLIALRQPDAALAMARSARAMAEAAGELTVAALARLNEAVALMELRRYGEALPVFEEILQRPESIPPHTIANTRYNAAVCRSYLGLGPAEIDEAVTDPDHIVFYGRQLSERGEHGRAIDLFERNLKRAEARRRGDRTAANYRFEYANALRRAGRNADAVVEMKTAADLLEQAEERSGVASASSALAGWTLSDGDPSAVVWGERAVAAARDSGDTEALAFDLAHLGQAYLAAARYDKAVATLEEAHRLIHRREIVNALADARVAAGSPSQAIPLYESLLAERTENAAERIHPMLGLAQALEATQQQDRSFKLLQEAHAAASKLPANEHTVAAYNRLGVALLSKNALLDSADVLEAGIERAQASGLKRSLPHLLMNLSNTLKALGDIQGANRTLIRLREDSRSSGDASSEARALYSLGTVALDYGQFDKARDYFLEAAVVASQGNDKSAEAAALDSAGITFSGLGKPERAVEYHLRAAALHEELRDWKHAAIDFQNLTQAYLLLQEPKNAQTTLRRVYDTLKQARENPDWQVEFIAAQVTAYFDWKKAAGRFRQAITQLEAVRSSLLTPGQQREWAARQTTCYSLATEAAIRVGDGVAAMQFAECNKMRFLQALQDRRRRRPPGVDAKTWMAYEQAADRRSQLPGRRRASLAFGDHELDRMALEAEHEYVKALAVLEQQMHGDPAAASTFRFTPTASLAAAVPRGFAVVSLATYGRGLGIACIGKNKTGKTWNAVTQCAAFKGSDLAFLIFGDRDALAGAIKANTIEALPEQALGWVLGSIATGSSKAWNQTITRVCNELGTRVWPEILKLIPPETTNLILMPAAGFNVLPLHAATLPDGSRIDERFTISYSPSLGVLKRICVKPLSEAATMAQAVNPTEDDHLPFSNVEAWLTRNRFRGGVRALSGKDADIESVMTMLGQDAVFHFSGHGFFDIREPFRSGLFCASGEKGQVLTMGMILNRMESIRSRFVVLSACETGQVEPDDALNDFLGLPGAFVMAGADGVLATLWRVDDLASCLLMAKFFEMWDGGATAAAEALRSAQRWLRDDVTVDYVVDALADWLDQDVPFAERLMIEHGRWASREDRNTRPFHDEFYWAPFYVTGLLPSNKERDSKTSNDARRKITPD
jgi:tetratricopeptide (TPR) repeat protein